MCCRVALAAWLSVLTLVLSFANPWLVSYWIDRPARSVGRRFSLTVLGYPAWGFPGDPIDVQGGLQLSLSLAAVAALLERAVVLRPPEAAVDDHDRQPPGHLVRQPHVVDLGRVVAVGGGPGRRAGRLVEHLAGVTVVGHGVILPGLGPRVRR